MKQVLISEIGRCAMEKTIKLICIIIMLLFLSGCSKQSENTNQPVPSTTSSSLSNDNSLKTELFDTYQITGEDGGAFSKTISQNIIDENYNHDFHGATTTQEMIDTQKKYIEIWKDEMSFSIDNFIKMINKEDLAAFNSNQKQWEETMISNLQCERNILLNEDYNTVLGSGFLPLWFSELRNAYRQRTFRIKYLTYLLETQTNNPQKPNECFSTKFKYKGK